MTPVVELVVRPTPAGFLVLTVGYTRSRNWGWRGDVLTEFGVLNLARAIAATGRRLKLEIVSDGMPAGISDFAYWRDHFYDEPANGA